MVGFVNFGEMKWEGGNEWMGGRRRKGTRKVVVAC